MKNVLFVVFNVLLIFKIGTPNDWGFPVMPVDEVKPGMTGTAHTIFYGENIEEIGVEVIDVMHNFYPKLDVILVRLLGETATKTGVVSGMSGSPVYIDGKLVGQAEFPHTTPLSLGLTGGITVGADPGAPVAPFYKAPFEFTGTVHTVTIDLSGEVIEDSEAEMRMIMARQ